MKEIRLICLQLTEQTESYYSTIHALDLIYFDSNTWKAVVFFRSLQLRKCIPTHVFIHKQGSYKRLKSGVTKETMEKAEVIQKLIFFTSEISILIFFTGENITF